MKILALDSSAGYACAALLENTTLLHEVCDLSGRAHSETLLPLVSAMLEKHRLRPHDIDLFVCSAGPGSFTGVRIGVATVKGLCSGTEIPCVGLSSLEVLAQNCRTFEGVVCPVIDARRDRVFTALFSCKDGALTRLCPDCALSLGELDALLKKTGRVTTFTGDGCDKAMNGLTYRKKRATPERLRVVSAYEAGRLGYLKYLENPDCAVCEKDLLPVYLGQSQAQRAREEKE